MRSVTGTWLLVLVVAACRDRGSTARTADTATTNAAPVNRDSSAGWYLGFDDSDHDRTSWFLRLDPDGRGAWYSSRWVNICQRSRSPTGEFAFRGARWFGSLTFDGFAAGDTISGMLKGAERSYGRITFRSLDRSDKARTVLGGRSGVYSTASYNEQGGDMTGGELVAGTLNGAAMISLQLFGDALGPSAARDIRRSNDTLHFRFEDNGPEWRAVFRDSAVALWFDGAIQLPGGAPIYLLPWKESLETFFEGEPTGLCLQPADTAYVDFFDRVGSRLITDYRLPEAYDFKREWKEYNNPRTRMAVSTQDHAGHVKAPFWTSGFFNADQTPDYAYILIEKWTGKKVLVALLSDEGAYRAVTLRGNFEDEMGLATQPKADLSYFTTDMDKRQTLHMQHEGIVFLMFEGAASVFVWDQATNAFKRYSISD